ncbi:MAG: hypothetical protein KBG11_01145 [Bacteroidia bacterium]|jgi:hypothetical protein|nr:hypothetical protein [Bacteroidia bacterium]
MTKEQTLTILFLIGLTACNSVDKKSDQTSSNDSIAKIQSDTEHLPRTGELYKKTPQQIEEERKQDIADSINMVRTLELAMQIANKQKDKNNFALESDTLNILYGHILSSSIKHLIIKRTFQYGFNTEIYKLYGNDLVKVCSKDMAPLAYIGDTIQDVNGDNQLDYLFHWYPMSGCCTRDIYDVFLQKSNGDFSREFEFINPTFSTKEKIVRGMCYGYSAPLYKYKWRGFNIDTVEYVYFPDTTNGGHYLKRKHKNENEKGQILKGLPDEYKKIGYGID